MEFKETCERAWEIRKKYEVLEMDKYGRKWTKEEVFNGFVGDVGDLSKLVLANSGMRDIENKKEKLSHELADCLWSILVLSKMYDVDIEKTFFETMDELEDKI